MTLKVRVKLLKDRLQPGWVTVERDDEQISGPWPCRGKADNARAAQAGNQKRDPLKPYGDTPCGIWRARIEQRPFKDGIGDVWIQLDRWVDARARAAIKENGGAGPREQLGIHAGRGDGSLVPTYGCLRMGQTDFNSLCIVLGHELTADGSTSRDFLVEIYDETVPPPIQAVT